MGHLLGRAFLFPGMVDQYSVIVPLSWLNVFHFMSLGQDIQNNLAESRELTKPQSVGKTGDSMRISDENLLLTMSRRYARKIVGEEGNIKTALCSILSRHLPKKFRFNLIILNQSSTGKSYFLNNILEPIKDTDDIIDFTDF